MATYTVVKNTNNFDNTKDYYKLQFDGSADPNPGNTTAGCVLYDKNNNIVFEAGFQLGYGTNNIGEYTGLLEGLKFCRDQKIKNLFVEGDSMLVVNQIIGSWKVKAENLKDLYTKSREIINNNFEFFAIKHVYREFNVYADEITNKVQASRKSYIINNLSKDDRKNDPNISETIKKLDEILVLLNKYDNLLEKAKNLKEEVSRYV